MTESKRSDRARKRWEQVSPEKREEHVAKSRAAFRARYPAFVATYEQALAAPQPCVECGAQARPQVDLVTGSLIAWCCYACRPARYSRAQS